MKTILIATDGSEPAGQALDVAIDLARQTGATLQVLSVRPQRPAGRAGAGPAILEVEELDGPEHIAEAAALRAREAGVVATPHAGHGDVVNVISDAATSLKPTCSWSGLAATARSPVPFSAASRTRL